MSTLTKRRPSELDLLSVKTLDDLPAVHAAATAARDAHAASDALAARAVVLDQRAADADPLAQLEAQLERRRLAPDLALAEARAVSTRRASEAARETARREILAAHRDAFEDHLTRLSAKWLDAETEARGVLVWLDQLAGVVGHAGELTSWISVVPTGLRPGLHAEWRARLPGVIGLNV